MTQVIEKIRSVVTQFNFYYELETLKVVKTSKVHLDVAENGLSESVS